MLFLVATNVVASQPPEHRTTGTPHGRANCDNCGKWSIVSNQVTSNCLSALILLFSLILETYHATYHEGENVADDWIRLILR